MKKLCLTVLLWLACLGAQALEITLTPRGGNVINAGDNLLIDMDIAGLQSGGLSTELGAFHLDLYYDPDLLAYLPGPPSEWGTALGQTGGGAEALAVADRSTPGLLRLDEISLLDGAALDVLQGDSFRLATLAFHVMDPASTPATTLLFADDVLLADAAGNRIPVALNQTPELFLQVDEPATLAVFGLGLAALGWRRRHVPRR